MTIGRPARLGILASTSLALLVPLRIESGPKTGETARLITFGPKSPPAQGDDHHVQVLFLRVPKDTPGPLFVRLFDPDCGGAHDQIDGAADTTTTFSLYGGPGAGTDAGVHVAHPSREKLATPKLLKRRVYGVDAEVDGTWSTFAEVSPADGEESEGAITFRLVVEGTTGDDGNVFDVAFSRSADRNDAPAGSQVLVNAPTIRIVGFDQAAEMRFLVPPGAKELTIGSFDAAGARITFDSALRSVDVKPSGQGVPLEQKVRLDPSEAGKLAAVSFGVGGEESPNDAAFWIVDDTGRSLPVILPMAVSKRNARPVPKVVTRPLADCRSIVLDGSGTKDPDGDLIQLDWDLGDGTTARGTEVVHRYAAPGTYKARLTVTDSSGTVGNGAAESFDVVVNQAPVAKAGPEKVGEPGQPVDFDGSGSSDPDGKLTRYLWDFGDGKTGEGRNAAHAFARPGKYTVLLRVEDDSRGPCNFGTDAVTVLVNYAPVAVAGEDVICSVGDKVPLDGSRSYDRDGTLKSHAWDFGDGSTAEGAKAEHVFRAPGTYKVTLKVRDDAGARNSTASDTLTVTVNDPPVAVAGADRRLAVGEVSTFDGSGSVDRDGKIVSYSWDFGDGGTAKGRVVPYAYAKPGTYTVALKVRDNSPAESGVGSSTLKVQVNAAPVAAAGVDMVVTASTVKFDGTRSTDPDGKVLRYEWDFGDGTRGTGAQPVHVYRRSGTYVATLRVSDDSGTTRNESFDRVTVRVNERPVADAGADRIVAPEEVVTFSSAGSHDPDGEVVDTAWSFGDGGTATGRSVTHAWKSPGIYTVRLTVKDDTGDPNAVDYDEAVVRVNARPKAKAGPAVLAAPGQEVRVDGRQSFDPDGRITRFDWRFSDGKSPAATAVATRTFAAPGLYTARLTVTDDSGASNGTDQDEVSIRINTEPRAVPGKNVVTCDPSITFDGGASVDPDGDSLTYLWSFGDGSTATGQIVTHVFAAGGKYPVTLTVDDGTGLSNARHTAFMTVTINQPPIARAGKDITVCAGKVALFDGSGSSDPEGGLLRYRWDMGDGTTFEGVHPTRVYKTGGVYVVKLRVDDDSGLECGFATDQLTVRVVESPVADAGGDRTVCANSRVVFDGTKSRDFDGVVNHYGWDFGDGTRGAGATPEHTYSEPGVYRVRLTVTGDVVGDCASTDTAEIKVTVLKAALAKIVGPDATPVGKETKLEASGSPVEGSKILRWDWEFGDGAKASGASVSHAYAKAGRYGVVLTITTDSTVGCATVRTERAIVVNEPPVARSGGNRYAGVNQPVDFDGGKSTDADGVIVGYLWDFGDGESASGPLARHRYRKAGRYKASLRVTDDAGLENSATTEPFEVVVGAGPVPVITADAFACPGEDVAFSGAASTVDGGTITSYRWSFGDGATAEGVEAKHVYPRPGRYTVTLAVDDGRGASTSRQEVSRVLSVNLAPVPEAGPDVVACAGDAVVFDGSRSVDQDGKLTRHRWTFGDGTEADGEKVTHAYGKPGVYDVQLAVSDDSGKPCGTVVDKMRVRIDTPPVAVAGPDREAFVGGAHDDVFFDGTGSSDADSDPLTFRWEFGDGATGAGPTVYHRYTKPGTYKVRLVVSDGTGAKCGQSSAVVSVDVKARPGAEPVATPAPAKGRAPARKGKVR